MASNGPPGNPILRNDEIPALFWDDMPDNPNHPDLLAINALNEESTPEERAASFKDQGNSAVKTGLQHKKKFYLRQAIEQYTEGINLLCSDKVLNSILYANRAHVNLLLGNLRNAYLDGRDSIREDPSNIKAYYRAAKGALGNRKYDDCREMCRGGLEVEPANKDLKALIVRADVEERKEQKRVQEEEERQRRLRSPAHALASVIHSRGWKIGRPQFSIQDRKPEIDADVILWPALFFYPEASMQHDTVEVFGEHDEFRSHLDLMYGEEAPPLDWDTNHRYTRPNIEVYYLSNSATPISLEQLSEALHGEWPQVHEEGPQRYGAKAAQWVRIQEQWTLGEVLAREDHVTPGIPVFFVLAKDTPFKDNFLAGDIPLL